MYSFNPQDVLTHVMQPLMTLSFHLQETCQTIIRISETTACSKVSSEILKAKPNFSTNLIFFKNLVNVEDRLVFAFRCACADLIKSLIIPFRCAFFSPLRACFHIASFGVSFFLFFFSVLYIFLLLLFFFFYSVCNLSDMKISLGGTFLPPNKLGGRVSSVMQTNKGQHIYIFNPSQLH